ncbi:EamA family transporter RarD [Thiomonas sp.]|jgi:chloramphenicol-sensitive protein RarD|uniref:EamA family transporter RarD n=1 Tax=Thiomonas sp. TaxID=2047785 RepID=UPI002602F3EF|nr:EamA family transporter RarD [Thiomonas sp.]
MKPASSMSRESPGIVFACAAYAIWGLYPLYFKLLQHVPALQILAHRVVWSLPLALAAVAWSGDWRWLARLRERPAWLAHFGAAGLLLVCNWGVNIWAVNHGHVVDASLGFFLNPLLTIGLATLVLHEPLRRAQRVAIVFAVAGVAWMGVALGVAPWIAVALAASFAGYSLLRKTAPLGAFEGLALETALVFPLAIGYLAWLPAGQANVFLVSTPGERLLLAAAGPVTTIPLLLFAAGARRIPLAMLGILQYVTPTMLLCLGVALYRERFDVAHGVGFGLVWIGIAIYLGDRLRPRKLVPTQPTTCDARDS